MNSVTIFSIICQMLRGKKGKKIGNVSKEQGLHFNKMAREGFIEKKMFYKE